MREGLLRGTTSGGDAGGHHLDCGDGFMGVNIYQNVSNFTH